MITEGARSIIDRADAYVFAPHKVKDHAAVQPPSGFDFLFFWLEKCAMETKLSWDLGREGS